MDQTQKWLSEEGESATEHRAPDIDSGDLSGEIKV